MSTIRTAELALLPTSGRSRPYLRPVPSRRPKAATDTGDTLDDQA